MSTSRELTAKSTSGRARHPSVNETPPRNEVLLQHTDLHSAFEGLLADMSAAISVAAVDDIECEITQWLNQLAQQLGAERCAVGEFYSADEKPRFLLRLVVGHQSEPFEQHGTGWIQSTLASGQVISISSLDELPAEAVAAREQLAEVGIRSGLWVPMLVEGSVVGGMGLSMLSCERVWPAQIIQRCRLVADVFGNAIMRRRRAAEIEERIRYETLLTDISTQFMNLDGDIDIMIDAVLGEFGDFLNSDRVSYVEVDAVQQTLMPTRQWIAAGIQDDDHVQYENVFPEFPWLAAKILAGETVAIEHLDQFPDQAKNERQYCERLDIQSFTMVPVSLDGVVVAALALDNIHRSRTWDERIIQRLHIVAELVVSCCRRLQQQRELNEIQQFERAVCEVSTAFVNLPPEAVNDQIEKGLCIVAKALGADLVALLQPQGDSGYAVTHEWGSDGVNDSALQGAHVEEDIPWLIDRLKQNKPIAISNLSEFPAEAPNERAAMVRLGLQSALWVPFKVRGKLAGHLAINKVRPATWSKALTPQLRILGEVFGEALNRRDAEIQLQKSFKEIEQLKENLQLENVYLRQEVKLEHRHDEIIGDSAALRAALIKVEQVAPTDSTVLISGETGTGKELLARAIHENSSRRDKLMVKVNCAALPSSLVESELFGREKGAYTGALSRELGRFEIADGSTILLDEIGELSLELQAKLLRVLQDGEFERLGSSKTLHADVRVLAATNKDLAEAVACKEFREDLFYRLNVFPIEVPPLRDRMEDIPQLVWAFVQELSQTMGKSIDSISRSSMDFLKTYSWPGNVREVRNIIERAMIVSKGPTLEVEIPRKNPVGARSSQKLAKVEREHILAVVESKGWRIRGDGGAAETLGLKPTTLEARMKKLGIERTPKA